MQYFKIIHYKDYAIYLSFGRLNGTNTVFSPSDFFFRTVFLDVYQILSI